MATFEKAEFTTVSYGILKFFLASFGTNLKNTFFLEKYV